MENSIAYGSIPQVTVRLVEQPPIVSDKVVTTANDAAGFISRELSGYDREVFCVLNLRANGSVINMNIVSMGDLTSSLTHPREVFKSSILSNAALIMAFHNHPSGRCTPSQVDYDTTKRLVDAGKLLGIPVVDHIIVGRDDYYSFSAHNELGKTYRQAQKNKQEQAR